jgi:hypothetical protein
MGHQTQFKECKKCKGITISTIVTYLGFGRKQIISTNCKCKKDEKTS